MGLDPKVINMVFLLIGFKLSNVQNLYGWMVRNISNNGNFDDNFSKKPWIFVPKLKGIVKLNYSNQTNYFLYHY